MSRQDTPFRAVERYDVLLTGAWCTGLILLCLLNMVLSDCRCIRKDKFNHLFMSVFQLLSVQASGQWPDIKLLKTNPLQLSFSEVSW